MERELCQCCRAEKSPRFDPPKPTPRQALAPASQASFKLDTSFFLDVWVVTLSFSFLNQLPVSIITHNNEKRSEFTGFNYVSKNH